MKYFVCLAWIAAYLFVTNVFAPFTASRRCKNMFPDAVAARRGANRVDTNCQVSFPSHTFCGIDEQRPYGQSLADALSCFPGVPIKSLGMTEHANRLIINLQ